jgi:hypothetical protein
MKRRAFITLLGGNAALAILKLVREALHVK